MRWWGFSFLLLLLFLSLIKWARRDDNRRRSCVTSTLSERTNERRTIVFCFAAAAAIARLYKSSHELISVFFLFSFSFLWFVKRSSWVWIRTEPCHFNRIPRTRPVVRPRLHREHLAPDRRRRNSRTSVVWCEFIYYIRLFLFRLLLLPTSAYIPTL